MLIAWPNAKCHNVKTIFIFWDSELGHLNYIQTIQYIYEEQKMYYMSAHKINVFDLHGICCCAMQWYYYLCTKTIYISTFYCYFLKKIPSNFQNEKKKVVQEKSCVGICQYYKSLGLENPYQKKQKKKQLKQFL